MTLHNLQTGLSTDIPLCQARLPSSRTSEFTALRFHEENNQLTGGRFGYLQGSGGGPSEDNVSGHLVRSVTTGWRPNSVLAVDAGTCLAGIIAVLERTESLKAISHVLPRERRGSDRKTTAYSPFSDANLPYQTPRANAGHVLRELISTFLITHSHLDHISGMAIATAALKNLKNKKRIAGLSHTINSIRKHILNDVIWPNLSDEDGGVGLVTYMRIAEGAQQYVWVADGLSAQAWPISHGHCMKQNHFHKGSRAGTSHSSQTSDKAVATPCVIDSTTYFIKDEASQCELLMWGDVEPGKLHSSMVFVLLRY